MKKQKCFPGSRHVPRTLALWLLALGVSVTIAAAAPLSGAIFTTTPDGGIVNENVRYESKLEVYLDGGPGPNAPQTAAGLPDGYYVFQVTDPPGKVLLSEDPARCRVVRVGEGIIQQLVPPMAVPGLGADSNNWADKGPNSSEPCHLQDDPDGEAGARGRHDTNTDRDYGPPAIVVQLMPFFDTPNPGGVYKAWMIPLDRYRDNRGDLNAIPRKQTQKGTMIGYVRDPGFGPPRDQVKTDNFKVREAPPVLHVFKFRDTDGDGYKDDGEPEITGWKIWITEMLHDGTTVTNICYTPCWEAVAPDSTVTVEEELPQSPKKWYNTYVTLDGNYIFPPSVSVDVTFAPGDREHTLVFGNSCYSKLSGTKFEDRDAGGQPREAGESGLAGWTIFVDYDGNGELGDGEPSATTDSNGAYTIEDILPGTWSILEVPQENWTCSFPASCAYELNFECCEDPKTGYDFGNWYPAEKSGTKFEDLDADGQPRETGENGLAGWKIYVDYNGNGAPDDGEPFAFTDEDGNYTIKGIRPGDYVVREVLQTEWTCSYPDPCYHAEAFRSGDVFEGNDFGNWHPAKKSGLKYQDNDRNGAPREYGEPVLAGWTFYVDYNDNGMLDSGEPFDVSGEDGTYEITGIRPGTFKVREDTKGGYLCTFPNPCHYEERFVSRAEFTGNDFGNWPVRLDGCTPGYWKNHPDAWLATPYRPHQLVADVFASAGMPPYEELGAATLMQGLDFPGGETLVEKAQILLRASIASVLNSSHPDLYFAHETAWVIAETNAALDSGDPDRILDLATYLDRENNRGCPLN